MKRSWRGRIFCHEDFAHLTEAGENVGVLLPNIAATPLTLMSLWSLGRTPALLNYTAGESTMLACSEIADLKVIVTSMAFLEAASIDGASFEDKGLRLVYLEDIAMLMSGLMPSFRKRP